MDACNACRLALSDGIVIGAGKSMLIKSGNKIIDNALSAPYKQLVLNNEEELNTEGVWDSTLVIKNAIKNAISLAGIILTTQGDIRLPERSFEDKQLDILQSKRTQF